MTALTTKQLKKQKPKRESKRGKKTSQLDKARAIVRPKVQAGGDRQRKELAKEHGIGNGTFETAIAAELAHREGEQAGAATSSLSMTAKQKLDAAIKVAQKKMQAEFDLKVQVEVRRRINEMVLPAYNKKYAEFERVIKSRKGIMSRVSYKKILSCLHPDRVQDAELKVRYEDAFNIFTKLEKVLLDESQSPTDFIKFPRTVEELMAMRKNKVA